MKKYDVIIIGGGVMGAAAAYYLSLYKKSILLIDFLSTKNVTNASRDYSKVFRASYGKDVYYSSLAIESLRLLRDLEVKANRKFYSRCGVLLLNLKRKEINENINSLQKLNRQVTLLNKANLNKKYPQLKADSGVIEYDGGILDAFAIVDSYINFAKQNGVTILENKKVISVKNGSVLLEDKEKIEYTKIVIAAGTGTNELLDNKLPITITKQNVIYIRPNNISQFNKTVLPAFIFLDKGYYGVPVHGINAVKVSSHTAGGIIQSLKKEEKVDKEYLLDCRKFLNEHIPDLADAKVVSSKVCYYDMTPDEGFIVDFIDNKSIVAAGFSGHGFKFAPLIGKSIADLILFGKTKYDISRFQLKRFS